MIERALTTLTPLNPADMILPMMIVAVITPLLIRILLPIIIPVLLVMAEVVHSITILILQLRRFPPPPPPVDTPRAPLLVITMEVILPLLFLLLATVLMVLLLLLLLLQITGLRPPPLPIAMVTARTPLLQLQLQSLRLMTNKRCYSKLATCRAC